MQVRVLFFLELRVHHCAVHSVHNRLFLHLANRASFTCKTDSFSWGHGPDALACKARPSSDKCGTSLSVSLSLSLSPLEYVAIVVVAFLVTEQQLAVSQTTYLVADVPHFGVGDTRFFYVTLLTTCSHSEVRMCVDLTRQCMSYSFQQVWMLAASG